MGGVCPFFGGKKNGRAGESGRAAGTEGGEGPLCRVPAAIYASNVVEVKVLMKEHRNCGTRTRTVPGTVVQYSSRTVTQYCNILQYPVQYSSNIKNSPVLCFVSVVEVCNGQKNLVPTY